MDFMVLFALGELGGNLHQCNPWNIQSQDSCNLTGYNFSGERLKALGRTAKFHDINISVVCFYQCGK